MADFDVVGDVMGDDDVDGYDDVGAAASRRPLLRLPAKPSWRKGRVSPGLWGPREGLEPLPLNPNIADGVFDDTTPQILFDARPQRPFRPERLLVRVARSAGAGGVLIFSSGIFVGTSLQQVELGPLDLENFAATAFGVRLALVPAEPGVLIRIPAFARPGVPVGETVAVSMMFLGRTIGN